MSLKIHDRVYVSTHNGEREIQLCLGDITKLSIDEAVDVIIVSSYPGWCLSRFINICSFFFSYVLLNNCTTGTTSGKCVLFSKNSGRSTCTWRLLMIEKLVELYLCGSKQIRLFWCHHVSTFCYKTVQKFWHTLLGDYIPMRGTLIGALRHNLDLSVQKLAKFYMKEDLRKNFSCWISHKLDAHLPYRFCIFVVT